MKLRTLIRWILPPLVFVLGYFAYQAMVKPAAPRSGEPRAQTTEAPARPGSATQERPVSQERPSPQEANNQERPTSGQQGQANADASDASARPESNAAARGGSNNAARNFGAAFRPGASTGPAISGTAVRAIEVSAQPQASELRLLAQVQASLVEDISAPALGRVAEILVAPGQSVELGQALLQMSSPELEWQNRQRQATLDETLARQRLAAQQHQQNQARLQLEQEQLARVQRLHSQGFASDTELQNARNQLATLQLQVALFADEEAQRAAQIEQARIQLEQSQYQLAQLSPEAPFASLVAELLVSPQQRVQPGQALLRLLDPSSLALQVRVPAQQLPQLAQASAELRLPSQTIRLAIGQINPISEQGTVRVQLPLPADAPVVSGQTLDLWLQLPLDQPSWAVPEASLYQGNTLYLIEDGRLQAQRVQVLGQQWREQQLWYLVVPAEGFTASEQGAQVLTTRLASPITGQPVRVAEARP